MQSTLTIQAPHIHRSSLYGSPAARFVAFLVDTILLLFLYSFILYATTNTSQQDTSWNDLLYSDSTSLTGLVANFEKLFFNIYFPVVHWLYYTVLESSTKQATIGKFTLGLRVTDLRGKRINFFRANLRYFLKFVSALLLCLGFILILFTRRRQMLHDYLASTLVTTA